MADWSKITSRGKIDDRRGLSGLGGISLTGVALVVAFTLLTGGDLGDVVRNLDSVPIQQQSSVQSEEFAGEDDYEVFASTVLGSTTETWTSIFEEMDRNYQEPNFVLFRDGTRSACGVATSSVGPHYCPADETIYIDERFFDQLVQRFDARGGDVAEAYVIAHEVGHHVQHELGIAGQVREFQQRNQDEANQAAIAMELQADCFAGLWANSIRDLDVLEPNEIEEAIDAAEAVGDDNIQQKVQGQINPETWTHGSSQQRNEWFMRGYNGGDLGVCDTFE